MYGGDAQDYDEAEEDAEITQVNVLDVFLIFITACSKSGDVF